MAITGSLTGLTEGVVGPIAGDIVLTIGKTSINGGTNGYLLMNNNGNLSNVSPVGIGTVTSIGIGQGLSSTQTPLTSVGSISLNLGSVNLWTAQQSFPADGVRLQGSGAGYTTLHSGNTGANAYTITLPAVTSTVALLGTDNAFTGANTFTSGKIRVFGTSTGYTELDTANTSASNYALTLPAATGTLALLQSTQAFTGTNTFSALNIKGSSTGYTSLVSADTTASNYTITLPASTGTVGLLEAANAWSAANTFTQAPAAPSITLGSASGVTGSIALKGVTSGTTTLTCAAAAGSATFALPNTNGTNGYVLKTDGAGNTSWTAAGLFIGTTPVSGTSGAFLYNNGGVLGERAVTGTSGNVVLQFSPNLTGAPTCPTQSTNQNDTSIANTLYVYNEIALWWASVISPQVVYNVGGNCTNVTTNTQPTGSNNTYLANTAYADATALLYGQEQAQYWAGVGFAVVWSYIFAFNTYGAVGPGDVLPGGYLYYADSGGTFNGTLPGSWQCCGNGSYGANTLWRRVA